MLKSLLTGTLCLVVTLTGCGNSSEIKSEQKEKLSEKVEIKAPLTVRNDRKTGGNVQNNSEYPTLNISQIFQKAKDLDGKRVRLVVYEGIRSGDSTENIPPLMTRSDGYVHDEHGTLMMRMGWQYSNTYNQMVKENPEAVFKDDHIKIDKGRWEITPIIYYKNGMILLSLKELR